MSEFERRAADYSVREVSDGPVLQNRHRGEGVDLLRLPAPKWHEHDGGKYLGTGCIVITKDPDSGRVNFGSYRLMLQDKKTVTLHISPAHHGAINVKKYHDRGKAAPVAVSLGHHPLYLVISGMGIPYGVSEYNYLGMHFIPLTAASCGCRLAAAQPVGPNTGQGESSVYPGTIIWAP